MDFIDSQSRSQITLEKSCLKVYLPCINLLLSSRDFDTVATVMIAGKQVFLMHDTMFKIIQTILSAITKTLHCINGLSFTTRQ